MYCVDPILYYITLCSVGRTQVRRVVKVAVIHIHVSYQHMLTIGGAGSVIISTRPSLGPGSDSRGEEGRPNKNKTKVWSRARYMYSHARAYIYIYIYICFRGARWYDWSRPGQFDIHISPYVHVFMARIYVYPGVGCWCNRIITTTETCTCI